jgi:hypothetical protein
MWNASLSRCYASIARGRNHNFLSLARLAAYQSFCQQRKEELANVCSFSGERAATRIFRLAISEVVRPDRRSSARFGKPCSGFLKRSCSIKNLEHGPEKRMAVFRRDHAQSKTSSATAIQPNCTAL